jgi:predicted enzyme related to lactoylglutathione lyase
MGAPIVHIEFKSADFERTAAFYEQLFGWKTAKNASSSYMKVDNSDGPSTGWIRADLVQSPGPVAYLTVDDLPGKLEEVEQAGGRVLVRSMPFAGGGEIGLVADPDGNVLGLWRPKAGAPGAPGGAPSAAPDDDAQAGPGKATAGMTAVKPAPKPAAKPKKKK